MRIPLLILGFLLWQKILIELIGSEATVAAFLLQAMYCRIRYFREDQILHPEVM